MKYFVSQNATDLVVSVEDLKAHLFLFDHDSYDDELEWIILSAQDIVSDLLGEHVSCSTITYNIASFGEEAVLPHRAVSSIQSIHYYDTDNNAQLLPEEDFIFDFTGKDLKLKFLSRPTVSKDYDYPISVDYLACIDPMPYTLAQAILIVSAELFEVRSETTDKARSEGIKVATKLLMKHRRW
jgi:uncharacterized phiE125 gp8 family phage protein